MNAHNRMLGVTFHRNLETTYLKDLEEGAGASSRRLLPLLSVVLRSLD
jgi:hypothetical protein